MASVEARRPAARSNGGDQQPVMLTNRSLRLSLPDTVQREAPRREPLRADQDPSGLRLDLVSAPPAEEPCRGRFKRPRAVRVPADSPRCP
jgi:hypothetical protein